MYNNETIAAIATGLTNAGISVIRVSGEKAFDIGNKIFFSDKNVDLKKVVGYTAHFGKIIYDGEMLDEAVVLVMKAPHSYTGEDTIEISCHGGVRVTKKILEAVIKSGARSAQPGEFTKRAFLNGKMDMAKAEAVIDLIEAENDFAMKASLGQLSGRLSDKIRDMRDKILDSISYIEAALDDPEHISLDGFGEEIYPDIKKMIEEISDFEKSFEDGKVLSEGVKTVILGKPNAGKSSLMNLFSGDDRAIVTDIAGTTRDVLTEKINLKGISFILVDTAGIHESEDVVEKIGIEKSLKQAESADLILFVVDSSREMDNDDIRILDFIKDKKSIVVYNKTDLSPVVSKEDIRKKSENSEIVGISAKNATDFDELKEKMISLFDSGNIGMNNQVIITNIRHKEALMKAKESLVNVVESMKNDFSEDMWTIDLTAAYAYLGEIVGEALESDVVDRIFEKFCMGK